MIVAASLVISACGDLTPDPLAYATDEAEPTLIRIATPRIAGFEDAIAAWEREHPTAEVEIVLRANDDHHRSLINNTGAGGQFDIIAFDSTFAPDLRERPDIFMDLASLDTDLASWKYLDSRWAESLSASGAIMGVPVDVESTALLVRTDLVPEVIIDDLESASTWCDVIIAGDRFSDESKTAFLSDGDDLLRAILSQARSSYVDEFGQVLDGDRRELEDAWDLVMIALGEGPIHGDPCPNTENVQRIARNLTFNDVAWRSELRSDDFAAVLAPWSMRRRISNAAPETAGQWTTIALPTNTSGTSDAASEGGLHLGIHAGSANSGLAYDLISTLADPIIQELTFADGQGPLPAAVRPYTNGTVSSASDTFFGDARIGAIYGAAASGRPDAQATPQRRIVVNQMIAAVNQVESGGQTPGDAWVSALREIDAAFE